MTKSDLFGRSARPAKTRIKQALERHDRASMEARLARMRWLQRTFPSRQGFMMPLDTFFVFEEAKATFLNGQHIATVVLSCSFVEHRLGAVLTEWGFENESRRGLKAILDGLRKRGLADDFILNQADTVRLRRNPFVHLKEFGHSHSLGRRALGARQHPLSLLEEDAKVALSLMFQVALGKGLKT